MAGERFGCEHVPLRFDAFLDNFESVVGTSKALAATRMLIDGGIKRLFLSGPPGVGKTRLAASAMNELAQPMWTELFEARAARQVARDANTARHGSEGFVIDPAEVVQRERRAERQIESRCPLWLTVPTFLGDLRREIGRDRRPAGEDLTDILAMANVPLVLDDVGAEKPTDWVLEHLFELVESRYLVDGPLIVTSNLTAAELAHRGYSRVVSRLADTGALIELRAAKDYRQRLRVVVA